MRVIAVLLLSLLPLPTLAAPDGPALFRTHCASCHGVDGRASTWRGYLYFAKNLTSPGWQAEESDDDILRVITRGTVVMPAFGDTLDESERRTLVKVVRQLGNRP